MTTRKLCPLHSAQHSEQHMSPEQRFEQTFVRGTAPTGLEAAQQYLHRDPILFSPPPLPMSPLFSRVSSQSAINPLLYQYPNPSDPTVFVQPLPAMHIDQQQGVPFNPMEQSYCNNANVSALECSNPPPISSFMPKYTGHHQYPRLFRAIVQPRFSPPFVNIQIQFPTPPPYIPKSIPRQSRNTTEDNPIVISEDDESAPVSECGETQESSTKPEMDSNTADLISFDYAIDDSESSPKQQPVESSTNTEQQLPISRPPYSYSALIGMAIMSSPNKELGVRDIYNAISGMFPYYEKSKRAWKNTVRQCLKTNKCFKLVEDDKSANKSLWMVDENSGGNFMKGSFQKSKVPRKRPYVVRRPRLAQKTVGSGVPKDWSLDSIWLLYANELQIKTIPNPNVHILELLPPDSPPAGSSECFKTYIS